VKTVLAAIFVLVAVLIRVLLWLSWDTRDKSQHPARFSFLLVVGWVTMGLVLLWFWFAMRTR